MKRAADDIAKDETDEIIHQIENYGSAYEKTVGESNNLKEGKWSPDAKDLVSYAMNVESLYNAIQSEKKKSSPDWEQIADAIISSYEAATEGKLERQYEGTTDELAAELESEFGGELDESKYSDGDPSTEQSNIKALEKAKADGSRVVYEYLPKSKERGGADWHSVEILDKDGVVRHGFGWGALSPSIKMAKKMADESVKPMKEASGGDTISKSLYLFRYNFFFLLNSNKNLNVFIKVLIGIKVDRS